MSDDFPQFSEQARRRRLHKVFFQINAIEEAPTMCVPAADSNDTPAPRQAIGDTPPYQELPKGQLRPPFPAQNTLRAQPLIPARPKQQQEGGKWLAARQPLWESDSFTFDIADDGFEVERLATTPLPTLRGGIWDPQVWSDAEGTGGLDSALDRQDTIPMMVLKGVAELQGQSPPVMES